MKRICVVEDEASLSEMIQLNLTLEGYNVTCFNNGTIAQGHFENDLSYDLIILDVMLPGLNGIDLCKEIRIKSLVPVLFLSAKGTTTDRIEGLKAGANDYLPKPFDLEELLLRIAILTNHPTDEIIQIGHWKVNFKTYHISNNNESYSLSKKEMALLQFFNEREGEVISRSEILDNVWGKDQFPTTRTIDNFILNFRKIFEEDPKHPVHFISIRGVGYRFMF